MKLIWNVITILAFLNIVALLGFFGWLANSGRMNEERLKEVREIFGQSVQAEQMMEQQTQKQERIENGGIETVIPDSPPVTAEDQLALRVLKNAGDRQRIQRLEREVSDLQAALQRERQLINSERSQLESDKAIFHEMRQGIAQTEGAEQFRKALSTLESVKPKAAKDMLLALIKSGNRDEAVGYLNAMQDRSRTKIISELVKAEETPLAAELLEELRVRGVSSVSPEVQSE